jgi:hypothetical protein
MAQEQACRRGLQGACGLDECPTGEGHGFRAHHAGQPRPGREAEHQDEAIQAGAEERHDQDHKAGLQWRRGMAWACATWPKSSGLIRTEVDFMPERTVGY